MKTEPSRQAIYLKDYQQPEYLIDTVDLTFYLDPTHTRVVSQLSVRRNPERLSGLSNQSVPLILDGESLTLNSITLDGRALTCDVDFTVTERTLTIHSVPEQFRVQIEVLINPKDNTALQGLYLSNGTFCTQCEAQGFRRITYYLDRPDVLARFTTTIISNNGDYPALLSNGDKISDRQLESGQREVTWRDPFPKAAYLFALVAGKLASISDHYKTKTGKDVEIVFYVEAHNIDKCAHAIASLKRSMKWDEEVFGLSYDLNCYMVVAVSDFNMGAMENKGLNIFNDKYVLANPATATDADYEDIESVIGHEYFHNWTGNRVTLRDWFQLSLKEGLTVFREQQFSADMGSALVKRIEDVNIIRTAQFAEDASPMAHPVRPASYIEMNNFYTVTVYNKGAEVIRMLHTLLGVDGFRRGMDLYFSRYDGDAVTTDDFVSAMEDANQLTLPGFRYWYSQAGTPVLDASWGYDADSKKWALVLEQSCPLIAGESEKQPFLIPVRLSLLDSAGKPIPLYCKDAGAAGQLEIVLAFNQSEHVFIFEQVPPNPTVSLLHHFSAPVKTAFAYTTEDLVFLMAHSPDSFARWDAAQQLALNDIMANIERHQAGQSLMINDAWINAIKAVLTSETLDKAAIAQIIAVPGLQTIIQQKTLIDIDAIYAVYRWTRLQVAERLKPELLARLNALHANEPYAFTPEHCALRRLHNTCLKYLSLLDDPEILARCVGQLDRADNMTDRLAALDCLANNRDAATRESALERFYQEWQHEPLVVNKWLSVQAGAEYEGILDRVKALSSHAAFQLSNPNKIYALWLVFAKRNVYYFHQASGEGYRWLADRILELDAKNPQVAARLTSAFLQCKQFDSQRAAQQLVVLKEIAATPGLSKDVYELVHRTIG